MRGNIGIRGDWVWEVVCSGIYRQSSLFVELNGMVHGFMSLYFLFS